MSDTSQTVSFKAPKKAGKRAREEIDWGTFNFLKFNFSDVGVMNFIADDRDRAMYCIMQLADRVDQLEKKLKAVEGEDYKSTD